MKYFKSFCGLPFPLIGLFLVFLSIPLFSLILMPSPWALISQGLLLKALVVTLGYWLTPLLICYSILDKHYWFFPLYLLQCALLTLHAITAGNSMPEELQAARFILIGLMIYVGLMFGNKNYLYPLITREARFWRKAIRFQIGRNIFVITEDGKATPGLMLDGSRTGMRISVHIDDAPPLLRDAPKNEKVKILVPEGGGHDKESLIAMEIVWSSLQHFGIHFGCRALDKAVMKNFIAKENPSTAAPLHYPGGRNLNLEHEIQETALVLWLVCIVLSFALPAMGM